ncbi:CopD family protein [Nocardioides bruguierae]|uniref:5-dehydro-4-deoxy-D-glucuronate isomerase n=1 Tax=Nocardioides bruguierae TaxID=2945102 RepID=A0A9X2D8A8_9ACTN|nr:CopD family protein [Nocardioides bruguierae]MCM0620884.1 5-dehydro-4-deoxy-D-glucuronate isomerase [Nocardioides bruguierae]
MIQVRHSTSPAGAETATTADLRRDFLVEDLFVEGRVTATYTHDDRMVLGGAVPGTGQLDLPAFSDVLGVESHLERRELGIINVGQAGHVLVDGDKHELEHLDGLYVGRGSEVSFAGADAAFYFVSAPAHATYPTTALKHDEVEPVALGSKSGANERHLYRYAWGQELQTAVLQFGVTVIADGSVWNTFPPHLHDRRTEASPEVIGFDFTEPVSLPPGGVQVFDASGVPLAAEAEAVGDRLEVRIDAPVEGTVVVVWRIISLDTHPVAGSLTFSVGEPSPDVTPPPVEVDASTDPPVLLAPARWLGYLGLLAAGGLAAGLVLLLPAGMTQARRRVLRATRAAVVVGALGWLATVPLSVLYQVGGDASALADPAAWAAWPRSEWLVLALVLVGLLALTVLLRRDAGATAARAALAMGGLAVVAPALSGHTRAASPQAVAIAADAVHLLAGAAWLGGLVALVLALSAPDEQDEAATVLGRFSVLAGGLLALVAVTGTLGAWLVVDGWSALLGTSWGRVLLVKVAVAVVVVALAAWNRFVLVPRLRAASRRERGARTRPVLRVAVAEAVLLVGVLGLTAVLVDQVPEIVEPAAAAATGPVTGVLENSGGEDLAVAVELSPRAVGPVTVTIRVTDAAGVPTEGLEPPRVRLLGGDGEGPDLGLVPLTPVSTGTYAGQVTVPTAGEWDVEVSLRTGEFTNPVAVLTFDVPG